MSSGSRHDYVRDRDRTTPATQAPPSASSTSPRRSSRSAASTASATPTSPPSSASRRPASTTTSAGKARARRGADRRATATRFAAALAAIDATHVDAPTRSSTRYAELYSDVLRGRAHVPVRHARRRVRDAARRRWATRSSASSTHNQAWLARVLADGRADGTLAFDGDRPRTPPTRFSPASRARCSSHGPTKTQRASTRRRSGFWRHSRTTMRARPDGRAHGRSRPELAHGMVKARVSTPRANVSAQRPDLPSAGANVR